MDYNTDLKQRNPPHQRLREIEVPIILAQDLKNLKHVTKMRAYAVVYVQKGVHVAKTHVDEHGGTNPAWNEVVKVRFKEDLPERDIMAALNVDVYAHGHVVLLCDVLKRGDASEPLDNPIQRITVQVWRPSGRPHGWLNLWVPPTGRFLLRRESLSFSVKEAVEGEEKEEEEVEKNKGGEFVLTVDCCY
ncbi:hypothetical protein ACJW31_05G124300 [Castanea mollissima]